MADSSARAQLERVQAEAMELRSELESLNGDGADVGELRRAVGHADDEVALEAARLAAVRSEELPARKERWRYETRDEAREPWWISPGAVAAIIVTSLLCSAAATAAIALWHPPMLVRGILGAAFIATPLIANSFRLWLSKRRAVPDVGRDDEVVSEADRLRALEQALSRRLDASKREGAARRAAAETAVQRLEKELRLVGAAKEDVELQRPGRNPSRIRRSFEPAVVSGHWPMVLSGAVGVVALLGCLHVRDAIAYGLAATAVAFISALIAEATHVRK